MKSIIIAFTICLALNSVAQEKVNYTKYGNTGKVWYDEDGDLNRELKVGVKNAYKSLVGLWNAQDGIQLSLNIKFYESIEDGSFKISDFCEAKNISHQDFQTKFEMMIGGTVYDDINNLNKIYFQFGPSDFTGGVNQVYVSGFLHVLDANTLRMEIMGIQHPSADDDEIVIRPDYKLETAPADIKARVPAVLRRKTITFKRETIDLPPPPFDGDGPAGL